MATNRRQSKKAAVEPQPKGKHLVDNPRGVPIRDASKDILLAIRSEHIRKAVPLSSTKCAAAVCANATVRGVIKTTINKAVAYVEYKHEIQRFLIPTCLSREIVAIDRGAAFAEGDYPLKAPSKGGRLDRIQKRKKYSSKDGSRGETKQGYHVTAMVRGA